jgi:GNAT superfamily N-acetyltransferase
MRYEIVYELNNDQLENLCSLFEKEWWTRGRNIHDIKKMLVHSDVIVGICESETKELIGFSRVLTDFTYKAFILDVVVKESYRGKKLGRVLMNRIMEHPLLNNVQHYELYCRPEMLPFYEKWGFTNDLKELQFIRKLNG